MGLSPVEKRVMVRPGWCPFQRLGYTTALSPPPTATIGPSSAYPGSECRYSPLGDYMSLDLKPHSLFSTWWSEGYEHPAIPLLKSFNGSHPQPHSHSSLPRLVFLFLKSN